MSKSSNYGAIQNDGGESNNNGHGDADLESSPRFGRPLAKVAKESIRSSHSITSTSFVLPGVITDAHDQLGTATITSEVANIAKNLIGSGVLSLSGGIAIYSNNPNAVYWGGVWVVLLGVMFGYFCILIAKVCNMTGSSTYRECWEATMGSQGALAVAIIQTLLPAQGDLAYATVLSQTLRSLLETCDIYLSRVTCLILVTIFVILPLCLMKNLDALAPFSAFGVGAVGIAMLSMVVRYFDGSYQSGGDYYTDILPEMQSEFGTRNEMWSPLVLPYLCMIFQSWVMHYNSPRFYMELKDATIPRFTQAVGYSFGLSATIYIVIGTAGFLTFGGHCDSYILNNYSPKDPLATASRLCIAFSTLLTYPLAFFGVRDGCLDIFQVPQHLQTNANLNIFTVFLLTILTTIAAFVDDLGLINAVGGGCLATFLCFVFPAVMYRQAVKMNPIKNVWQEREVWFSMILMVLGVILGIVGVYESIAEASSG